MKVKINECYVKCDICKQKIERHTFHNNVYQMKVKSVEQNGLKPYRKIDMCYDCYNRFSGLVRKELREEKKIK